MGARLEGAIFKGARFDARTSFRDAKLPTASWKDVDLSMVRLSQAQVNTTFGDTSVILPEGLTRPAHWPSWKLPWTGENSFNSERARWRENPAGYHPPDPPAAAE